ncbi:MAG TPA: hypothetical protein DHW64_05235 [Chitinophagaceae bacterium]|jgi:hypothetical protein|nr:hypothetical protein [Chitinophagaceae bacterium]
MKIISNHIVELLALLAALWNLKHIRGTRYFYFIPFLAFTLLGELGGTFFYISHPGYVTGNTHIYLWVVVFGFIFFGHQFYEIFQSKKLKWITAAGITVLVSAMAIWFCFWPVYTQLYYNTYVIGGFFLCCISCVYMYQQFIVSDDYEVNLMHVPDFWLVMGILLFYVGNSITFALHYFLKGENILIFGMKLYHFFPRVLSVFLYGFMIVALFLWKKYREKYLSAS